MKIWKDKLKTRENGKLVLWISIIILLDQITKLLILKTLEQGTSVQIIPFFELTHIYNTGIAFGLSKDFALINLIAAIIITCIIILFAIKEKNKLPFLWIIAGAISNIIDRCIHGAVLDYISMGDFPVFNLADASITVGGILLAWSLLPLNIRTGIKNATDSLFSKNKSKNKQAIKK